MKENFELRLREIKKLKSGWHFGVGEPFTDDHVEVAIYLANKYNSIYGFTVSGMPNVSGDIELVFSYNDKFLDISLHTNMKEFSATYSEGIGNNLQPVQWGIFELRMIDAIMSDFYNITKP